MRSRLVTVFLCGDVMTGRGIDQILRHPSAPRLHEPAVDDAREYVELAERRNGPIPREVDGSYLWGDALEELERVQPDSRSVNLETSITRSDQYWPGKEIHYRMHSENVGCLTVADVADRIAAVQRPGDVGIVSIHWGSNWGYGVSPAFVRFAHQLIDAEVDIVHAHSSHHVRPIEVYRNHLILYGCGDFINDYEGIIGYEKFRDDLVLMYFPTLDAASGELVRLRMVPMKIMKFRLTRPSRADVRWLEETVTRIGAGFGSSVELADDGSLLLRWRAAVGSSDQDLAP